MSTRLEIGGDANVVCLENVGEAKLWQRLTPRGCDDHKHETAILKMIIRNSPKKPRRGLISITPHKKISDFRSVGDSVTDLYSVSK